MSKSKLGSTRWKSSKKVLDGNLLKKKILEKNRQIEVHNLARKEIEFSRFFSPVLSFDI